MGNILPKTFPNVPSSMKMIIFIQCVDVCIPHSVLYTNSVLVSLMSRTEQPLIHYLNQWYPSSLTHKQTTS